ncbi:MAG: sulfatase [Pseudomonadota bacterium]|nr:sulfatase [Pseudomonadota bacterium]
MKQLRAIVLFVALANIALVAFLLLRTPAGQPETGPRSIRDAVRPLVSDAAMDDSAYDLEARADRMNIIFISMDALRYDRAGFGGNPDGLTPNLDQFAEEAVVFSNATSAAPWTLPSHMSIWTGRWPSVHGVTNKLKMLSADQMVPTSLSPGIETFPDYLIRNKFTAAAFTGGAGVQASFGFGRDFTTYVDDKPFAGFEHSVPPALDWLSKNLDKQFFLFLHGYDAHGQHPLLGISPRDAVPGYNGTMDGSIEEQARLREQGLATIQEPGQTPDLSSAVSKEDVAFLAKVYDKKVKMADERLGSFLAQLRAMGLLDTSIIVLFSDHGDEFLEHGYLDHGATLCEHQLHVPVLMRFPGYARRNDVSAPIRTIDLFPTVFDALGIPGPAGVDGRSILPILRGKPDDRAVLAETDYRLFVHQRMKRVGDKKLVLDLEDGGKQLFDVRKDPDEQTDISSSSARETYEMEQALRTWMDATRTNPQDYLGVRQKPIELF